MVNFLIDDKVNAKFKIDDNVKVNIDMVIKETHTQNNKDKFYRVKSDNHSFWIGEKYLQLIEPEEPTQPITKENIREVLEYNNIDFKKLKIVLNEDGIGFDDRPEIIYPHRPGFVKFEHINISWRLYIPYEYNPKWLQHLEIETGKLKGLPIPKHEAHWVITKNGVEIKKIIANRIWCKTDYYSIETTVFDYNNKFSFYPKQYKGKESNFTILFTDGSVAYAKWVE